MSTHKPRQAAAGAAEGAPIKGSEVTIRCLEQHGVDVIFAYPGGASMELHQALCASPIRVILPRHEQGGAFAAAGYARATGKPGVCMATSGPGATNLVTGITDAYMDSVPLVAITGQVPQKFIGKNAFQETDIIGITRPIVKHSYLVLDPAEIPEVMAEAFYLATSGRPGPVVIDLPKDVQQKLCVPQYVDQPVLKAYTVPSGASQNAVERIREAIRASERPCLYTGGGIITSGAHEELLQVAESYNIPVVTSLMGIGGFPESHPLSLKWPGMHGTYYANYALNECDLLIGIGTRYDDRVTGNVDTFAEHATIMHVDIDPSEINKNKRADIGVVCDAKDMLSKLLKDPIRKDYEAWHKQIREWKEAYPLSYRQTSDTILPQAVIETLYKITEGNAIVVTGVGQHQMWAAQFYKFNRPRQLLTSGGLGTMGFGLPSAMGAKIACPDDTVVLIDGDGSFQMNIQELGTIHCEDINVKMIILNNQHLGMVAQWEDRFYNSQRGDTVLSSARTDRPYPNFPLIAEGYMIPGRDVWKPEDVEPALREMLESPEPYLLDVHVQYQEHVLPMIPSGGSYKDIMVE
jgi:acetolactate synthase-1/2/3 large subunit